MGQLRSPVLAGNKNPCILWQAALFPAVKYKERCLVENDLKVKAKNIFLYNCQHINKDSVKQNPQTSYPSMIINHTLNLNSVCFTFRTMPD